MNPLHRFAQGGDIESIAQELAQGTPIDLWDEEAGFTPLGMAASSDDAGIETVRFLIEQGADIHASANDEGTSVLWFAMLGNDVGKVQFLLDAGANTHDYKPSLDSALDNAVCEGHLEMCRFLVGLGANPTFVGWTPLMQAAVLGTKEDVQRELSRGGDTQARDDWENTAWMLSLLGGDVEKVALLAEVSDQAVRGRCGETALMLTIQHHQLGVASWLSEQGADLDEKDDFGKTALMVAARHGVTEGARLLLSAGAKVDLTDATGISLRQRLEKMAATHPQIRQRLQSDAPYLDRTDYPGQTAIAQATNLDIVRLLVEAGEDLGDISEEMRAELTGLGDQGDVHCSRAVYDAGKRRRFGTANPEVMDIAYWKAKVRSRDSNLIVDDLDMPNDILRDLREAPIWGFSRFGMSLTELPDGRLIEIGGEIEDSYDPNFCIYNEVFIHMGGGHFDILGYPAEVFPPTDFHTATFADGFIYIIGCLGYSEQRIEGFTPVYCLDCRTLSIEKVETKGEAPGWIWKHKARLQGDRKIRIWGGQVWKPGGNTTHNAHDFVLDLATGTWHHGL